MWAASQAISFISAQSPPQAAAVLSAAGPFLLYLLKGSFQGMCTYSLLTENMVPCCPLEGNAGFLTQSFAVAPFLSANHDKGTTAVQILYHSSLVKNPVAAHGS